MSVLEDFLSLVLPVGAFVLFLIILKKAMSHERRSVVIDTIYHEAQKFKVRDEVKKIFQEEQEFRNTPTPPRMIRFYSNISKQFKSHKPRRRRRM